MVTQAVSGTLRWATGLALLAALSAGCGDDQASQPAPPPDDGTPVIVGADEQPRALIEAESATCQAPFTKEQDAEASGGHCLGLPAKGCDGVLHNHIAEENTPERTAGTAVIEFTAPREAEYVMWIRRWTCCSCGDSWTMAIDDGRPFTAGNQGTTHRHWTWMQHSDADGPVKFRLSAGPHRMTLSNRGESGFRIDQILLWADQNRVPQGKEKP